MLIFFKVLFIAFIVVVCIQCLYYVFIFSKFAFANPQKKGLKTPPVSVIICAKNEAENLKRFVPSILEQDYPNFELVLINDTSSDGTLNCIKEFEKKDTKVKVVDVQNNEAFWGNKKYALTLGIKAASHELLLFTDADCKPVSKNWIKEMSSQISSSKTIVLGYGAYGKVKNSLLNKLIRFETLLTAVQYFSYAKLGIPYMGVGRNLMYTKSEFFNANGFVSHMKIRSGDDDLFINQIAKKDNTIICDAQESFTYSTAKKSFSNWYKQKRRHISTATHYKWLHKFLLSLYYCSQLLFWTLSIVLLVLLYNWKIVLALVIFRFIVQMVVMGFSAKKLHEKDLIYLFPFLEVFLIAMQMIIFIHNLISKPTYFGMMFMGFN